MKKEFAIFFIRPDSELSIMRDVAQNPKYFISYEDAERHMGEVFKDISHGYRLTILPVYTYPFLKK